MVRSKMVDGLILMEVLAHDERVPFVADLDGPAVLLGVPEDPKRSPVRGLRLRSSRAPAVSITSLTSATP